MKVKKEIFQYLLYFVLFVFYFYLEKQLGITAFAIALFMALVYCKQNILLLIPLYVASAMIITPSIAQLIQAVTPCGIVAVAFFIHYKLGFKVKLLAINIYLFLSQIPLIFFSLDDAYLLINAIISILSAQIVLYSAVVIIFLIKAKGLKFKLTLEEIMSAGLMLASIGMGLIAIDISGYTPFYSVAVLGILSTLFIDKKGIFVLAITLGIGSSFMTGNPSLLALTVLYALVVSCFSVDSQYYAAVALIAVDIIYRAFFQSIQPFSYLDIISPILGAIVFMAIPNKIKARLSYLSVCFKERQGSRSLVNRDRRLVADKLNTLSGVFYEIQDILHMENAEKECVANVELLTRQISMRCCNNCIGLSACKEALGGNDTDMIISDLTMAALDNGKATILDTPPFLSSKCRKINALITATNDTVQQYREQQEKRGSLNEGRAMISEQMGGVGTILQELKKKVEKVVTYNNVLEDELLEELSANNIAASEAIIYGGDMQDISLTLMVKEKDAQKPMLLDIINAVLGVRMEISRTDNAINGMVSLNFCIAPKYQVVYGDRAVSKEPSEASGDKHSAIKIADNKVMLILSDGMGSGRSASLNSSYAMSLIESFYKAGFDYQTVINSVGKLLSLRDSEEFSAVDIAIIDTVSGQTDFIKMGGRESFIVSRGSVEVIECGSLPLGILEETLPIVEKRQLHDGSFVVMVSDGVIDVMGRESIIELLSECKTTNPDSVAEIIMNNLTHLNKGQNSDDASVLVGKVFCPI